MRSQEFLQEKSPDYRQRDAARQEIEKIRFSPDIKRWDQYTPEMLKRVIELSKITGRAMRMYNNESVGSFIDSIKTVQLDTQKKSGQLPEFSGRASTAREMARQIAAYTNGEYESRFARVWTNGYGQRSKDASDFVTYSDKQSFDDALTWAESNGKKVYYNEGSSLHSAIQLGRYVIQNSTRIMGAFSDTPQTTYSISVRSAASLNQGVRRQADITDQQAATLKDIADTKNSNAMEMIRAMINVLQGESDLKTIIANSKKITPQDKAKLDRIIAGAADFKEPQ